MNYSTCVIYKIKCKDETIPDLYVGHTFNLKKRTALHKSDYNNQNSKRYNYKLYQVIRSNGGFENWIVEVVEEYKNCISLEDARNKEKYWFNKLEANLNSNNPLRTVEEKKEQIKQYQQGEKFKEYITKYKQGDKYKNYNKEYNKQYREKKKIQQTQEPQQATSNIYNVENMTVNNYNN
jgi:hypothetical protein